MFAPDELAYRSLRAELALLLCMSEYQAERLMDLAYRTVYEYRKLVPSLASGAITQQHAQVICDAGLLIGPSNEPSVMERRAGYEAAVLEIAAVETPNRLLPIARRLAETWAEIPIETRHERARSERRVTVTDAEDGMADLIAHLPAPEAYAIRERLTRIAKSAKQGHRVVPLPDSSSDSSAFVVSPDSPDSDASSPDASSPDVSATETSVYNPETSVKDSDAEDHTPDSRTRDQFRADALVDLLLSSDPFALTSGSPAEAIEARIQLISPADFGEAESGIAGLPGELAGYGPVDELTVRRFAAQSSHLEKVTTHSDTGEVISVDRYRPSEQIRRVIGARDRHCRFPGCRVPIQRCDLDHTIDAAFGGETSTDNLGALCRGHHTLKHHSEWSVEQHPGGVFEWTSPTGRVHVDRPPGSYRWPARRPGQSTPRDPDEPPRRSSRVRFEAI